MFSGWTPLELCDKTLENVSAGGGILSNPLHVSTLLHGTTVVYTHLNTSTWVLQRVNRSEDDMVSRVLPAVCQSLRASSPALVSGMLGALRMQIFASLSRLGHGPSSDPRSSVFEPSCPFALFAYIVYVSPQQDSVSISWKDASRSWEARFKGPAALESQFGVICDGPYVQVIPNFEVLFFYSHKQPDKLRITVHITRGQGGGASLVLIPSAGAMPL
jgi:hypothetical protein